MTDPRRQDGPAARGPGLDGTGGGPGAGSGPGERRADGTLGHVGVPAQSSGASSSPSPGLRTPRVLISGATGFLGSHFLLSLHETRPSEVWALVRGPNEAAARGKLQLALRKAAESYRAFRDHSAVINATRVILGDITLPICAVASDTTAGLAASGGLDEFWHFAASLNFDERQRAMITAHNIGGTGNAVELARRAGARRFIYVSTAYTCGKKTGDIPEALHDPAGPFNNCYEESKCAAEHLVTRLCAEAGLPLTILRPSIVIGPSETRLPGGSRSGLYGFVREMNRLATAIQSWSGTIRLHAQPDLMVNLIPVDYFVEDLMAVVRARFDVPPILHVTAFAGPRAGPAILTIASGLGIAGVELYQGPKDTFSPLEQLIDQRMAFYGGYLSGDKTFLRTLPAQWSVSDPDYRAFAAEAIRERRRAAVSSIFVPGTVRSFDGATLTTYTCGNPAGIPVILSNAMGMPAAFWTRIATRLGERYRVIAWETRGVPSVSEGFSEMKCGIDAHVGDLVAVLDAHQVDTAHVVGWCTGALVALKSGYTAQDRVRSLVLLNGNYSLGPEHPRTPFERNMRLVMPKIAGGRNTAEHYYRTIYLPKRSADHAAQGDETQALVSELLMSTDPDLIHLTSVPYDNVDALHRYGRLLSEAFKEDIAPWVGQVRCPALVVTSEVDATDHPEGSRFVASLLPGAELLVYPEMDHFGLFSSDLLADDVAEFLDSRYLPEQAGNDPHRADLSPDLHRVGAE